MADNRASFKMELLINNNEKIKKFMKLLHHFKCRSDPIFGLYKAFKSETQAAKIHFEDKLNW